MLVVAGGAGAISGYCVVATEKVKNVCALQGGCAIGATVVVDQEGELEASVFAKHAGVICVREADGGKGRAFGFKLVFMFAQLRDVLAAENSAVVAQKHDYGGRLFP
jgi:hypothetical protein